MDNIDILDEVLTIIFLIIGWCGLVFIAIKLNKIVSAIIWHREQIIEKCNETAYQLLMEHLTVYQRFTCKYFRYISCRGELSREKYIIYLTYGSYNITRPSTASAFCITTKKDLPIYDIILAQYLLIKCCEDMFLYVSNRTFRY